MNTIETFQTIENMYAGRPFKDKDGRLTYVPDPLDCLLNACILFESLLYSQSGFLSNERYESFLKSTLEFLESVPLDIFKSKVEVLESGSKDIILRTLEKIIQAYPDEASEISEYTKTLLF